MDFSPCWKRAARTEPVHGLVLTSCTSELSSCHGHAALQSPSVSLLSAVRSQAHSAALPGSLI